MLVQTAVRQCRLPVRHSKPWWNSLGCRWIFEAPAYVTDAWWAPAGDLVLWRSVSGRHASGAAFIAGVRLPATALDAAFDEQSAQRIRADEETGWPWPLRRLDESGYRSLASVLPLVALATAGDTFDAQQRFLAGWLTHALQAVGAA